MRTWWTFLGLCLGLLSLPLIAWGLSHVMPEPDPFERSLAARVATGVFLALWTCISGAILYISVLGLGIGGGGPRAPQCLACQVPGQVHGTALRCPLCRRAVPVPDHPDPWPRIAQRAAATAKRLFWVWPSGVLLAFVGVGLAVGCVFGSCADGLAYTVMAIGVVVVLVVPGAYFGSFWFSTYARAVAAGGYEAHRRAFGKATLTAVLASLPWFVWFSTGD